MYLYGASGHAKVIIEILEDLGDTINGVFDDNENITSLLNYKCTKFNDSILDNEIIISIGNNSIRKEISDKLSGLRFGKAIDPTSKISKRVTIDMGTVVMPGVIINSSCIIGNHNIINTNASIDHDCELENYVHVSPGVSIAGNVKIGEGSHIGIGACIKQNINIGKWCIIGAGSVIIKDIPDYSVVVGNPGKIIKNNSNEK